IMANKVYLVCWSSSAMEHPEYTVDAVFEKEEDAIEYMAEMSEDIYPIGKNFQGIYDEPWIEEFEVK
ncbi:hypothetical protein LCGC14_2360050, partial [marine sediment metagenome]